MRKVLAHALLALLSLLSLLMLKNGTASGNGAWP
jgi:hypothetical protein